MAAWADRLLAELAGGPTPPVRVVAAADGLACLVLVWPAHAPMPTARRSGGREGCRADVLAVLRDAGRPLTRKELVKALRGAHGPGTVAKALADLTRSGEMVNRNDKKGYRFPEWVPARTPSLFS